MAAADNSNNTECVEELGATPPSTEELLGARDPGSLDSASLPIASDAESDLEGLTSIPATGEFPDEAVTEEAPQDTGAEIPATQPYAESDSTGEPADQLLAAVDPYQELELRRKLYGPDASGDSTTGLALLGIGGFFKSLCKGESSAASKVQKLEKAVAKEAAAARNLEKAEQNAAKAAQKGEKARIDESPGKHRGGGGVATKPKSPSDILHEVEVAERLRFPDGRPKVLPGNAPKDPNWTDKIYYVKEKGPDGIVRNRQLAPNEIMERFGEAVENPDAGIGKLIASEGYKTWTRRLDQEHTGYIYVSPDGKVSVHNKYENLQVSDVNPVPDDTVEVIVANADDVTARFKAQTSKDAEGKKIVKVKEKDNCFGGCHEDRKFRLGVCPDTGGIFSGENSSILEMQRAIIEGKAERVGRGHHGP